MNRRRCVRLAGRVCALMGGLSTLAIAVGCAAPVWLRPAFDCAGPELAPADFPAGFRAQATYRLRHDALDVAYAIVLERTADEMVLLGFTPVGARAFDVQWTAAGVASASALGPMLRVSPRVVARDLRRAWVGGPDEPGVAIGVGEDGATRIRHEGCDYTAIVRRANGVGASD